jgi:hypothetical protein
VTITGTNLLSATSAALGGVNITGFTVVNTTTITGNSGAHSNGAVAATAVTLGGTATLAGAYTYT